MSTGAGNVSLPNVGVNGAGNVRTNLSWYHLYAAARTSRQLCALEAAPSVNALEDAQSLALGATMHLVAAAESKIEEIYFDEIKGLGLSKTQFEKACRNLSALDLPEVLKKYQAILDFRNGCPLETFGSLENVRLLIKLRNNVVHYKPTWYGTGGHRRLSSELLSKFSKSPFSNELDLFPNAWVSYSFCKWGMQAMLEFLAEFHLEIRINNSHSQLYGRIKLE